MVYELCLRSGELGPARSPVVTREKIINTMAKSLNDYEFHDAPVKSIQINCDPDIEFVLSMLFFDEELQQYQNVEFKFKGVEYLKSGELILNSSSSIEVYSLENENGKLNKCKIIFLIGFSRPSFELEFKYKTVEIRDLGFVE